MRKVLRYTSTIFLICGIMWLGFYIVTTFLDRQSKLEFLENDEQQQNIQEEEKINEASKLNDFEEDYDTSILEVTDLEDIESPNDLEENSDTYIDDEDCFNECAYFPKGDELRYCQQICGLIPTQVETLGIDCESLEERERDYCWRNQAISTSLPKDCDHILDTAIRDQCERRIVEDIMDEISL